MRMRVRENKKQEAGLGPDRTLSLTIPVRALNYLIRPFDHSTVRPPAASNYVARGAVYDVRCTRYGVRGTLYEVPYETQVP